MHTHWKTVGPVLGLVLLVAGCGDIGGQPIEGTWIMAENSSRTMTVREDGSLSANVDIACTGTATNQSERTYRLEFDCGITKYSLDGSVSADGKTLTLKDPSTDQNALWNRK